MIDGGEHTKLVGDLIDARNSLEAEIKADEYEQQWIKRLNPMMYCPGCGAEYSACPVDYWFVKNDKPFRCEECDKDYVLAVRTSRIHILNEQVTMETMEQLEKERKQLEQQSAKSRTR